MVVVRVERIVDRSCNVPKRRRAFVERNGYGSWAEAVWKIALCFLPLDSRLRGDDMQRRILDAGF